MLIRNYFFIYMYSGLMNCLSSLSNLLFKCLVKKFIAVKASLSAPGTLTAPVQVQ